MPPDDPRKAGSPAASPLSSWDDHTASIDEDIDRAHYDIALENYRIVRKIGEGGMGIVFEAEQQNPRRHVALKIIRGGPFAGERAERLFQREILVLAKLHHPGIADIYDCGKTRAGQWFHAMELARGKTLDTYLADSGTLVAKDADPLRATIRLFQRIAAAVSYAHQRGVIHRDLKPSNILVADRSENSGTFSSVEDPVEVKLLDFGLARVTEPDPGEESLFTATKRLEGTLAYMSPEQVKGNPDEVDVRTDVYSLGLVLYRMICGNLPYDVRRLPLPEASRVICEDPPKPVTTTLTRSGKVPIDLETIISTALEKTPARRYQSVAAMAEDLRRFLADEPIVARAPTAIYQLRKMIARHKAVAIFSGVLTLIVLSAAIALAIQARQVRIEAATADGVSEFMMKLFLAGDPGVANGRDLTVSAALTTGAKRVADELGNEPEIQSRLQLAIGKAFQNLGDFKPALAQYQASLATRRKVKGAQSLEAADALDAIAAVDEKLGFYKEGIAAAREAVAIRRNRQKDDGAQTAESKHQLALNLTYIGEYPEAIRLYQEAIPVLERKLGPESVDLAPTLSDYTMLRTLTNDLDEAERFGLRTLAIRRKAFPQGHRLLAYSIDRMTDILTRKQKWDEATRSARESLAMRERLFGPDSPETGSSILGLVRVLKELGEHAEATSLMERKIAIDTKFAGPDSGRVAADLLTYQELLLYRGRIQEQQSAHRRLLEIQLKLSGPDTVATGRVYRLLAQDEFARKNYSAALELHLKSLNIYVRKLGEHHPETATSKVQVARSYIALGRTTEAEWLIQSGTDDRVKFAPAELMTAFALETRARFHASTDRRPECESDYAKALDIVRKYPPKNWTRQNVEKSYAGFLKRSR